jgi:hypothetical protein
MRSKSSNKGETMKSLSILLMASVLAATCAFAVVDPDTNSMGFYFDTNADVFEMASSPYINVSAYVILTNPDFGSLFGYEFGYSIMGNHMVSGTMLAGVGPIDVGGMAGNHIVGLAAPMPATPATILCTLSIFLLDTMPVSFTLTGASPGSVSGVNLPSVLLAGDVIISIGLSSGLEDGVNPVPCAFINATGIVATETASWGQIKSLYR